MSLLKIIFLLLSILSFSCKTRLEKEGWQRTAIVSQLDASPRKDKDLVVEKMQYYKGSYYYKLYVFKKDSTGKVINNNTWEHGNLFNCDIAYYKWESDSVCLVKLLNQGNVQTTLKLAFGYNFGNWNSIGILDELKK